MAKKKIAVIGVGKIAVDRHLPVIDKSKDFEVAATVSTRMIAHNGLPVFKTPAELYAAMPEVDLAICNSRPASATPSSAKPSMPASTSSWKAADPDHLRARRPRRLCQEESASCSRPAQPQ
jgi:hypothetical protein